MKCSHIRIEICVFSINAKKNLEMGWYLLAMGRSHSSPFRTTSQFTWWTWTANSGIDGIVNDGVNDSQRRHLNTWNIFASPRLYIYHLRDFVPILESDPHFRPRYHMERTWPDVVSWLVILHRKGCFVATMPSLFSSLLFQPKTYDNLKVALCWLVFHSLLVLGPLLLENHWKSFMLAASLYYSIH